MAPAADAASPSVEAEHPPAAPDVRQANKDSKRDYKGFVAGVFSGIAKLTGALPPPFHSLKRARRRSEAC